MRAHFGGYFIGQVVTFMYLTETMKEAPEFDASLWPQFSLFNLLVANFWPLYWVGYFIDKVRLDQIYWHVYEVAQARVGDVLSIVHLFAR